MVEFWAAGSEVGWSFIEDFICGIPKPRYQGTRTSIKLTLGLFIVNATLLILNPHATNQLFCPASLMRCVRQASSHWPGTPQKDAKKSNEFPELPGGALSPHSEQFQVYHYLHVILWISFELKNMCFVLTICMANRGFLVMDIRPFCCFGPLRFTNSFQ